MGSHQQRAFSQFNRVVQFIAHQSQTHDVYFLATTTLKSKNFGGNSCFFVLNFNDMAQPLPTRGSFKNYVNKMRWVGGQIVPVFVHVQGKNVHVAEPLTVLSVYSLKLTNSGQFILELFYQFPFILIQFPTLNSFLSKNSVYQVKHNGKPLHDRERLVRQSLEDISRASLDVSGCPWASRGIFRNRWGLQGFFGELGSLGVFGDLWGPQV